MLCAENGVLSQIELQFKTSFLRGYHDCKLTTAQEGKMEPSTSTSVKNIGVLLKLAAHTDNICIDELRFCRILCQKKDRQWLNAYIGIMGVW